MPRALSALLGKLDASDLQVIKTTFPDLEVEAFRILTRFDTFLPRYAMQLERLDYFLSIVPGFSWWRPPLPGRDAKSRDSQWSEFGSGTLMIIVAC